MNECHVCADPHVTVCVSECYVCVCSCEHVHVCACVWMCGGVYVRAGDRGSRRDVSISVSVLTGDCEAPYVSSENCSVRSA